MAAAGASALKTGDKSRAFANASQTGTVTELDRKACTVVVEGLSSMIAGDRIRLNAGGRGHNYQVVAATELAPRRHLLQLDVSSVLGRSRVASVQGTQVEFEFNIMTRTGNLHQTRLERESDLAWSEIAEAMNPDADRTIVRLKDQIEGLEAGEWVAAVDYVVGDPVAYEPTGVGS